MRHDLMDYETEVASLSAALMARGADPAYKDAPRFVSYARISTLYKARDDEKTIRQTWRNLVEIDRRGGVLVEALIDDNSSAWKEGGKRPAWDRLMQLVDERAIDGMVARFLDRLMRKSRDLESLLDRAERAYGRRHGPVIVGDHREYRLGNAGDNRDLRNAISSAQYESDLKSSKLRDLNEDRLAMGDDRNGPSPFGHRWPSERLSITDAQLEAERQAVRDGFAMVVERDRSWGDVAREWNRRGLTTRKGTPWNAQNVAQLLVLPRHAGLTRKGTAVAGRQADPASAIVDVAVRDRLMVKLAGRRKGRQPATSVVVDGRRVDSPHILSAWLRCGGCGYGMSGSMERGVWTNEDGTTERRRIYKCPPKGCNRCGVDARAAERWAAIQVVRALSAPEHAAMLARRDERLGELERRIREYEALIGLMRSQTDSVHDSRRLAHVAEIGGHEAALSPLLDERARLRASVVSEPLADDVDEVLAAGDAASPDQRRRMVQLALPDGFFCEPVGRGSRIRGEDILSRFSVERGGARPRRTDTVLAC